MASGLAIWAINWIHAEAEWLGWVCGSLFLAAGGYLIRSARPFASEAEQLLRHGQPCDMRMTIIVTGGDPDYDADIHLRFPGTTQDTPADLRVTVGYLPWMNEVTTPFSVKVWGAHNAEGPVVIDSPSGRLFPSGPGAISRHPRSGELPPPSR